MDLAYVGRLNIDSANQNLLRECLNRLKHVMVSMFLKITINNSGNIKKMLRRFVFRLILAYLFFFQYLNPSTLLMTFKNNAGILCVNVTARLPNASLHQALIIHI